MRHAIPAAATIITGLPVQIGNDQHIGQRDSQQDAYGFSHLGDVEFARHAGYVAVLADGMGGLENGTWASTQAVTAFLDAYRMKTRDEAIDAALLRAATTANACVYEEAQRLHLEDRMGSTLVAAAIFENKLHWISIGDSRVYLQEAGQLMRLSTDHNFSEVLTERVRRGEISVAEAQNHPMRNGLTSYLGRPALGAVDKPASPLSLRPGTWILLCSDGLSGVLSEMEIARELHDTPQAAASRLIENVLKRSEPHQDNVTVVVLQVPKAGNAILAGESVSRVVYANLTEKSGSSIRSVPAWIGSGFLALAAVIGATMWWQQSAPPSLPPASPGLVEILGRNADIPAAPAAPATPEFTSVYVTKQSPPLPAPAPAKVVPPAKTVTPPGKVDKIKQAVVTTSGDKGPRNPAPEPTGVEASPTKPIKSGTNDKPIATNSAPKAAEPSSDGSPKTAAPASTSNTSQSH